MQRIGESLIVDNNFTCAAGFTAYISAVEQSDYHAKSYIVLETDGARDRKSLESFTCGWPWDNWNSGAVDLIRAIKEIGKTWKT